MRTRRSKGPRFVVVGGLAAALGMFLSQASPAQALSYSHSGSCWGAINFHLPVGGKADYMQIHPGAWHVRRARCRPNRNQVVKFEYRFWGYDQTLGQWVRTLGPPNRSRLLPPGTSGWFTYNWYTPQYRRISIDVVVTWRTRAGSFIGRTRVDFNRVADYRCATSQCRVLSNAAVGAFFDFPPPIDYGEVAGPVACAMTMNQDNQIYERQVLPQTPNMTAPTGMVISWQPILFRYFNGTWNREVAAPELKGTFNGLYSDLPASAGFVINLPAYYRVAVIYRWYSNGTVTQVDYKWSGEHFQTYTKWFADGSFQVWQGDRGYNCRLF
jgi:hypothetical protein